MCEMICVKKKKISSLLFCCNLERRGGYDKKAGGEVGEVFLPLSHCGELGVAY